eukprot:487530-Pleurochrysis_carterae.AAC.1
MACRCTVSHAAKAATTAWTHPSARKIHSAEGTLRPETSADAASKTRKQRQICLEIAPRMSSSTRAVNAPIPSRSISAAKSMCAARRSGEPPSASTAMATNFSPSTTTPPTPTKAARISRSKRTAEVGCDMRLSIVDSSTLCNLAQADRSRSMSGAQRARSEIVSVCSFDATGATAHA